jgi:polysaccharide export outer membrane protein
MLPLSLHRRSAAWLVLFLLATSCLPYVPRHDYSTEPDPTTVEYAVGPGDIIDIKQWKNPDVSGRVRVFPDGHIAVPLLGQVHVAGLTTKALRNKLAAGLERFIAQPNDMQTLTIAVDEFQSYWISVVGEVSQPGHYQPGHFVTVLDAIALSRGFTPYAKTDNLFLLRRTLPNNQPRKIPLSYSALLSGKHPEMNLHLLRGDVLVVP